MRAVSDATPLIHLAKIGRISLLKNLFKKVYVPNEIYHEIIVKGKEKNAKEVIILDQCFREGLFEVREVSSEILLETLHIGERNAISLCKELKIKNLLIDEKEGYEAAEVLGLNPLRTTSLLLISLDKKIINLKEYEKSLLDLSESGYYMSSENYQRLINAGRNIGRKQ